MDVQVGQEVPQDDLPETAQPQAAAEVPASDLPDSVAPPDAVSQEQYGTGTQQAIAGIEGAAQGLAGFVAPLVETKLLGVNPEDIKGRAEANPWTHGIGEGAGLIGGALIPGYGEYTLAGGLGKIGNAGKAVAKSLELGKIGQTAIKMALEGGAFKISDNASKMILGDSDPEAPVASLLAGVPAATFLSGGLGYFGGKAASKVSNIAEAKLGSSVPQFLADLGNRFDFLTKNKDPVKAATDEAQHLFDTVSGAVDDGFSLKRDAVQKLTANMAPEKVSNYINGVSTFINSAPKALKNSDLFQDAVQEWMDAVSPAMSPDGAATQFKSGADVFDATDALKKKLQFWAKFEKRITDPNQLPFVNGSRALGSVLRKSLEDPATWGEMGDFQRQLNSAYSKMEDPLKDFLSSATSKLQGNPQVDEAKIASVFRSVSKGKPLAGFRDAKISNFFEPAQNMLDTVNNLHAQYGVENPLPPVSMNVLNEMLNKDIGSGAKFADWIFGAGPKAMGRLAAHVVGTGAGEAVGQPYWGFRMGEHLNPLMESLSVKPTKWTVGALLKMLSTGNASGAHEVADYASGIGRGSDKISRAVNGLFEVGGAQYSGADEAAREALRKQIAQGKMNQQLQQEKNAGPHDQLIQPTPSFAHGGEVTPPKMPELAKPAPAGQKGNAVAAVFPSHMPLLGAAKMRIYNYLNSIRPQENPSRLPFDKAMSDPEKERSYDKALDIANNPLSVLHHVKDGTLTPEHMQHMQALYPEVSNHLQKKITEKVMEAQSKGETLPHHVMQSMSLFLGSPLDSNLTPQNILAAQQTFVQQKAAMAPQQKTKKGTANLGKSSQDYRTADQAAIQRQIEKR